MFFFPISDLNTTKNKPILSWMILISCILIFIYQKNLGYHFEQKTLLSFGMIPSVLFNIKQLSDELAIIPSYMTLISSMFLITQSTSCIPFNWHALHPVSYTHLTLPTIPGV